MGLGAFHAVTSSNLYNLPVPCRLRYTQLVKKISEKNVNEIPLVTHPSVGVQPQVQKSVSAAHTTTSTYCKSPHLSRHAEAVTANSWVSPTVK